MFRKRPDRDDDVTETTTGPLQVVVTGDHPDAAELVARLLARADHTVVRAESVPEVLAALTDPASRVLVAVVAHGETGPSLLAAVREHPDPQVRQQPVVFLAAPHLAASDLEGADLVLHRPVAATTVVEAVQNVLRSA